MAEPIANTQMFDSRLRQIRLARAAARMQRTGVSFLLRRCLDDAAERIMDVNRRFKTIYLIADFDLRAELSSRLPPEKHPDEIYFSSSANIPPASGTVDLVLCLLTLHNRNNPPAQMKHMAKFLKDDGLFITALIGGESLTELRQSLYKTDDEILGGATPRVFPMITHSQAAPLITQAGLNLPVVDMDRFKVTYSRFETLLSDLRDIGGTNILSNRSRQQLGSKYWRALKNNYQDMFGAPKKLKASFEILWLTGWAPHESQQKPLKPGSATMSLAEALKPQKNKP